MELLEKFMHEASTLLVGALCTWIGNKASRLARDINGYWKRMRSFEDAVEHTDDFASFKAAIINSKKEQGKCRE
jgi:hypothetical protein